MREAARRSSQGESRVAEANSSLRDVPRSAPEELAYMPGSSGIPGADSRRVRWPAGCPDDMSKHPPNRLSDPVGELFSYLRALTPADGRIGQCLNRAVENYCAYAAADWVGHARETVRACANPYHCPDPRNVSLD